MVLNERLSHGLREDSSWRPSYFLWPRIPDRLFHGDTDGIGPQCDDGLQRSWSVMSIWFVRYGAIS